MIIHQDPAGPVPPSDGPAPMHDPGCTRCARMVALREAARAAHPDHHAAPVPGAGPPGAGLLIVGLAPGRLGANRTGIPFAGDASGRTLWLALERAGLRRQGQVPAAGARIVNAVQCLPPGNRPSAAEVANCRPFLVAELARLPGGAVVLALGRVAHAAVRGALGAPPRQLPFGHGARASWAGLTVLSCYHPSAYNFATGRLTQAALDAVVADAVALSQRRGHRARPEFRPALRPARAG